MSISMTESPARPNTQVMMTAAPQQREARFERLYGAELAWLLRTVRRLGAKPADVEDLAHDVLCVVHRRLDDFDETRPMRPWLFGIAVRVVSDYRRRASFTRESFLGEEDAPDLVNAGPEGALETERQRALVLRSLEALSDDQRVVFVAHDLDGTSIPELVEVLEAPLNTLYSRLRLARQHFKAEVERLLKAGAAA